MKNENNEYTVKPTLGFSMFENEERQITIRQEDPIEGLKLIVLTMREAEQLAEMLPRLIFQIKNDATEAIEAGDAQDE